MAGACARCPSARSRARRGAAASVRSATVWRSPPTWRAVWRRGGWRGRARRVGGRGGGGAILHRALAGVAGWRQEPRMRRAGAAARATLAAPLLLGLLLLQALGGRRLPDVVSPLVERPRAPARRPPPPARPAPPPA